MARSEQHTSPFYSLPLWLTSRRRIPYFCSVRKINVSHEGLSACFICETTRCISIKLDTGRRRRQLVGEVSVLQSFFYFHEAEIELKDFVNMDYGTTRLEVVFFKICDFYFEQFSIWRIFNGMRRKIFSFCMLDGTCSEIMYSKWKSRQWNVWNCK
jgi:hypothetical protein